jgi:hypothetical protein
METSHLQGAQQLRRDDCLCQAARVLLQDAQQLSTNSLLVMRQGGEALCGVMCTSRSRTRPVLQRSSS